MTKSRKYFIWAAVLAVLFLALLAAVKFVDVGAIGPQGSEIGLSSINGQVRDALGFSDTWYGITDWLGVLSILVALGFALFGVCQLVRRRSFKKVDADIYLLAISYAAAAAIYVLFEVFVVNYRPVILEESLEASFPSSHTVLVICFMGTAVHQFYCRIKHRALRGVAVAAGSAVIAVMVIGRLLSGVHWFTDILGGVLIGSAIVLAYLGAYAKIKNS